MTEMYRLDLDHEYFRWTAGLPEWLIPVPDRKRKKMGDTRAVVEVKWLLAAFPEAEMRNDVVWLNGSAFPVTMLQLDPTDGSWWAGDRWADGIG